MASPIEPNVCKPAEPDEPTSPPERARVKHMQSKIQRSEDYQPKSSAPRFFEASPSKWATKPKPSPKWTPLDRLRAQTRGAKFGPEALTSWS